MLMGFPDRDSFRKLIQAPLGLALVLWLCLLPLILILGLPLLGTSFTLVAALIVLAVLLCWAVFLGR